MYSSFEPDHRYYANVYKCNSCPHETIIFIDTNYSMFAAMESDKLCCICNEVKSTVSDGDLIMRYDWPDPDQNPWQLQSGFMKDEDRYCKACKNKVKKNWRKIVVACSQCDGYMEFNE